MIILISGGSCSGKTTFAKKFKNATVISTDDFYVGLNKMKKPYNFDEPKAVDLELLFIDLKELKEYGTTLIPKYDMKKCDIVGSQFIKAKAIIVVEGIFSLYDKKIRKLADLKIYIDTPRGERLLRRIKRDVIKGRSEKETIEFSKLVDKMHDKYVEIQKKFADLVIREENLI